MYKHIHVKRQHVCTYPLSHMVLVFMKISGFTDILSKYFDNGFDYHKMNRKSDKMKDSSTGASEERKKRGQTLVVSKLVVFAVRTL